MDEKNVEIVDESVSKKWKVFGITGAIFSFASIVFISLSFVYIYMSIAGIILSTIGVVLSSIGIQISRKSPRKKGNTWSNFGMSLGVITFIVSCALFSYYLLIVF